MRQKILEYTTAEQEAKFWALVDRGAEGACWLWTAGQSGDGYGIHRLRFYFRDSAHRIAFALGNGVEPGEGHVCHTCDVPLCCNPSHLFLGDAKTNALDKVQKGRARGRYSAKGSKGGSAPCLTKTTSA